MPSDLIVALVWSQEQWLGASTIAFIAITLFLVMASVPRLIRLSRKNHVAAKLETVAATEA